MIFYKDCKYNFIEIFNEENGFLIRSNIILDGKETKMVPSMRSFPELLDVGIMGTCHAAKSGICLKAGVDCYQSAILNERPNMSLDNYEKIINQCEGKTFQIALGGTGDPNKHENFEDILMLTRKHKIVPNLTTSGYNLKEEEINLIRKYCGAVAVSFYSTLKDDLTESNPLTIDAINRFINKGCKTNIHYILSKNSIDEALFRLQNGLFPNDINAVIFLLYKPVGLANNQKVLSIKDESYCKLISYIQNNSFNYKIGFDTCQSPALMELSNNISINSIDFCESARFSMYIDCDLKAYPCSFGHDNKLYCENLKKYTISEVWNSDSFKLFRKKQDSMCAKCLRPNCIGCALDLQFSMCSKGKK